MKKNCLMLFVLLVTTPAFAQKDDVAASPSPADGVAAHPSQLEIPLLRHKDLQVRPPFAGISKAFSRSGIDSLDVMVAVDYDSDGRVTRAALDRSTGDADLDAALLAWAKSARLYPGKAGAGRWRMNFRTE